MKKTKQQKNIFVWRNTNLTRSKLSKIKAGINKFMEKPKQPQKNILVVEDVKELAETYKKYLKGKYKIDLAFDGKSGLEKAIKNKYDLIITDIQMPIMSGFDMCLAIRNKNIKIPIIVISMVVEQEEKIKFLCDDFIYKLDLTYDKLLKAVDRLI